MKRKILILAGGRGTRMGDYNGGLPKVLTPLCGKPLISHLLSSLSDFQAKSRIGLVVGYKADEVRKVLGSQHDYYLQEEQNGTGHAVQCAAQALEQEDVDQLVVLCGDHPFVGPELVERLLEVQEESDSPLCMITVVLPDFAGWRERFMHRGRIVRNSQGAVTTIREFKDCTSKEKEITELNPSIYSFRADWLWENLHRLQNHNAQTEYYLTDLAEICMQQGYSIPTVSGNDLVCFGIDSPEDLKQAEKIFSAQTAAESHF